MPNKFVFFFSKLVRQKKSIGWAKYKNVCRWDMCWRNFSLVTKNVKSRSKIALFSNKRHFEIWLPKKKTIRPTSFWSKLSKLHKKDPISHVSTTFSLKQGKTRTSSGPIRHPLSTPRKLILLPSIRQGSYFRTLVRPLVEYSSKMTLIIWKKSAKKNSPLCVWRILDTFPTWLNLLINSTTDGRSADWQYFKKHVKVTYPCQSKHSFSQFNGTSTPKPIISCQPCMKYSFPELL